MSDDFRNPDVCVRAPSGNLRMAQGRMSYPHLFTPRLGDEGKPKFSVAILFPASTDLTPAIRAFQNVAMARWNSLDNVKSPFLCSDKVLRNSQLIKQFPRMIRFTTTRKPGVVYNDKEKTPCTSPEEAYAGRWALVAAHAFPWEYGGQIGVSFGLSNVMLMRDDARFGHDSVGVEDDFGDISSTPRVRVRPHTRSKPTLAASNDLAKPEGFFFPHAGSNKWDPFD